MTETSSRDARNAFEAEKPGTPARSLAEARIERLRERGGVFVEAVRATRMPMVVTDPSLPGNPIVFANEAFLQLSGYGMEEVLGQEPHFMNGEGTDEADAVRFRRALEEDRDEAVETVQYRKDGTRFVASVFLSAFKDERGRTLHQFLSYLDVTRRTEAEDELVSRRRIEAELRRSEARYRALFESMDEAYAVVEVIADEAGRPRDFRFLEVNPAFMAHTGMPDPVGRTATELLGTPNPRWAEVYGRVAETGEPVRFEEGELTLGRVFDLNVFRLGGPGSRRVAVLFTDVTARKRAEERLRESEERFRTLAETIDDVFYVTDLDRPALEYLSPSYERVWGRPAAELLADVSRFTETVHEDDGAVRESGMKAQRRPTPVTVEYRIRRPDGSIRHILDRTFPVPGSGGRRLAGVATDITDRKQAEAVLRESEERQAFLLKLSDALRPLADAGEIQATTARLLGAHLGADRAMYAEVTGEPGAETGAIRGQFIRPAAPGRPAPAPFPDRFTYESFGADVMARRYSGEGLAVADVDADAGFDATERAAWAGVGVRAAIVAPLVKGGRLVAELGVHSETSRPWTDAEISLVREVGERTWAAVERARAEAALRESEARQAFLLALGDAIRTEPSASGKIETAARRLGERLGASRVLFAEFDEVKGVADIFNGWFADGAQPFPTVMRLQDYEGPVLDDLRAGRTVRIEDVGPLIDHPAYAAIAGVGVRALISVPLTVAERLAVNVSVHQDKARRWTDEDVALVQDVAERLWAEVVRARAEEALRESEERFRQFADASSDILWIRDADSLSYEYVSPAFETIYGRPVEAVMDGFLVKRWAELIVSEDRERALDAVRRVLGGERVTHEFRVRRPDGEVRWVRNTDFPLLDAAGRVQRIGGIGQDVTELKRADARLREREAELARVQRIGRVGGMEVGLTDGFRNRRSPEYLRLHGLPPDAVHEPHENWASRIHPDDRAAAEKRFRDALSAGATEYEGEYRIVRPSDGAVRWISARGEIERDGSGRALRLVGAHMDVTERKEGEARLRESERSFRTLADTVPQLVWAGEGPSADYYNRRWYEYTGLTEAESLNTTGWHEVVHPDDRPLAVERSARTGEPYEMEYRLRGADGAYRWHIARAVRLEGTRRWIGAATDIDDLRRARDALAESEERFRSFADNSADTLWIVDAETGRLEYLSPAFEAMWGETREAVMRDLGRWAALLHPDDRERAAEGMPRLLAGETFQQFYRVVRPKDGAVRHIFDTGFPIRGEDGRLRRIAGIAQDVTEQKRAERRVSKSERRLRSLVEGIPQLVWSAIDTGRWTWASPQWTAYTGRTDAESRDHGWLEALHPDDRDQAMAAWVTAEATKTELAVEYRVRRAADGAYRFFSTRAAPVREDATGDILEWLGTSTDIDDLRRLQEHGKLLVAELQHRVRNTLGVIRSVARRTAETSDTVEDYAMHLDGRINAFARVQGAVTRDPTGGLDLDSLVAEELLACAAHEGEQVRIEGPPVRLRPKAAETFGLAIHELATNAVKHGALSVPRGRVRVTWRVEGDGGGPTRLLFEWKESGVPGPAAEPKRRGFGTDLIERTLAYDLKAKAAQVFEPGGLRCTIELPLDARIAMGKPPTPR